MNAPVTETTALISVSTTPAAIAFNYEETRAWLENELERYDVVVTADTLTGSKKLATELNKLATEIGKRRREAVAEVSGPIKDFEGKAKSLEQMCKDGRQRILNQVKKFESETLAKAGKRIHERAIDEWHFHGVDPEFRKATFDDLIKLTALTKTGKLAAATLHEISRRVTVDKQLQQQTEMRLLQLENQSYRAGLSAPLTRAHVETFLFTPDEEYEGRLNAVFEAEFQREKVAQERMRQRMVAEQQEAADKGRREEPADTDRPETKPEQEPVPESEPLPDAAQLYAFGPLLDVSKAKKVTATQNDIEQEAIGLRLSDPVGIWVPGQLIAIVYGGEVFRKC